MGVGEILDKIRSYYLDTLSDEVDSNGSERLIIEPAYRDSEGNIATEGFFNIGSRIDLAITDDGKSTRSINIDTEEMISFESVSFEWETSLQVKLNPFQWNYCPIELFGESINWDPIIIWYQKWFEEKPTEQSDYFNCVHFMSDPEKTEHGHRVYIDFGTASVSSIEEFLDSVIIAGVREIEVGSA